MQKFQIGDKEIEIDESIAEFTDKKLHFLNSHTLVEFVALYKSPRLQEIVEEKRSVFYNKVVLYKMDANRNQGGIFSIKSSSYSRNNLDTRMSYSAYWKHAKSSGAFIETNKGTKFWLKVK